MSNTYQHDEYRVIDFVRKHDINGDICKNLQLVFDHDPQFNSVYERWLAGYKSLYLRPSIDHIIPKAKGGTNEIDNLRFLTWFENRCKNDMLMCEWDKMKENIGDYFV